MPILHPSQYMCDNMSKDDVFYIYKRNWLYRLYRKYFLKDKIKLYINVSNQEATNNPKRVVYQEDLSIIRGYELRCIQSYNDEVPYYIYKNGFILKRAKVKKLSVGIGNIVMDFNSGLSLTIPTRFIETAITKNTELIKDIERENIISDQLKYIKYKEDFFKQQIKNKNIKEWIVSYCSVCGKPIVFEFTDEKILIKNECDCNNVTLGKDNMTYEEFALWFNSQTDDSVKKKYYEFWFNEEK